MFLFLYLFFIWCNVPTNISDKLRYNLMSFLLKVALKLLLNAINVTGLVVGSKAHNEREHLETNFYAKATGSHRNKTNINVNQDGQQIEGN